uniref:Acyltransferase n=1 Tax=Globisporangium ultimum (strain ATCC 200006 / CBS 805.95 / DAOM BR144) TaxID=431595 RepID=K3X4M3_GLOUD
MGADSDREPLVASETAAATVQAPSAATALQTSKALEYVPPPYFDAHSRVPTWLQPWIADTFNFVVIHYNLWVLPFLVLFYYLYKNGHGIFIVAMVALYIPRFLDGSERTANGRPWKWLWDSPLWRFCTHFLGIVIVREQELDASKRYIFGFHPHGILILSRLATYGGCWEKVFPNIAARLLGASAVFYVPLAREICLWLNAVDASRSTAEKVIKSGKSVLVYPGGVPEIFLMEPDSKENKIMLKSRLGFVKLAIRHGAELVPVFIFGEKWLYNVWTPPPKVVAFFRKTLKFPLIVFWGRFLWLPKKLPEGKTFGVVYGKPIPTTLNTDPSDDEVQAMHAQYVAEVERIFEQYKVKFGYDADETLVIV